MRMVPALSVVLLITVVGPGQAGQPPTLLRPSVTPTSGYAKRDAFAFTITYADPDGNLPYSVKLVVIGPSGRALPFEYAVENIPAEQLVAGTKLTWPGQRFHAAGRYGYYFEASDPDGTVREGSPERPYPFEVVSFTIKVLETGGLVLGSFVFWMGIYYFALMRVFENKVAAAWFAWLSASDFALCAVLLMWSAWPPLWILGACGAAWLILAIACAYA